MPNEARANRSDARDVPGKNAVPGQELALQGVASVMSVIRSVSVPLGISTPGQPNIASTIWRTVSDSQHLVYYYDSATVPNTFWVELGKLDFSPGSKIKRLLLTGGKVYSGETSSHFEPTEPFAPLTASAK